MKIWFVFLIHNTFEFVQIYLVSVQLITQITEFWRNTMKQAMIWLLSFAFLSVGQKNFHMLVLNGHVSVTVVMNRQVVSNGLGRVSVTTDVQAIQIKSVEVQMLWVYGQHHQKIHLDYASTTIPKINGSWMTSQLMGLRIWPSSTAAVFVRVSQNIFQLYSCFNALNICIKILCTSVFKMAIHVTVVMMTRSSYLWRKKNAINLVPAMRHKFAARCGDSMFIKRIL